MYELRVRFALGCSCHEAIRCLRVALLACLCAAFLMLAPCVAYAAQGDFASELPIVAESMSARGGASATSGPQDADNDVTFEKSGLVLENGVLTSYGTDGALKSLAGWQFFEGSWYWFDNSAIASASRWALDNGCWYYLLNDGRMATDTFSTPDGSLWHARTSGALTMGPGWAWDGAWYLVDGSGRLSTVHRFFVSARKWEPAVHKGFGGQPDNLDPVRAIFGWGIVCVHGDDDNSSSFGDKCFGEAFCVGFNASDVRLVQRGKKANARFARQTVGGA